MNDSASERRKQDLQLVRAVLAGSQDAWERFVTEYADLILAVLRRYLRDEDEAHDVFVEVLDGLYHRKLASYEGRSRLSTWLVIVSHNVAADHLRRTLGRRSLPKAIRRMSVLDQRVFRLYYMEGHDFETVRHRARTDTVELTAAELWSSLRRIEGQLDDRFLQRIAQDMHGVSVGALSERMLEFLDLQELEAKAASRELEPNSILLQMEARETAAAIQAALGKLPEQERQVLLLRYDQGWTAKKIASELGLEGEQKVYTLIRRGQRTLSRILQRGGGNSVE
jgi:RNA polymerase sigma factor (sigma-70 family)